jgi:hypothetical protein
MTAIGCFLFFGALMASLAGATLLWHGTVLDRMWSLNTRAYMELAPFGKPAGVLFLLLGTTLFAAGIGWFTRRLWGWRLATGIIATQVLGDFVNVFLGRFLEGATGVIIAGALLFYLLRPHVKSAFQDVIVGNAQR